MSIVSPIPRPILDTTQYFVSYSIMVDLITQYQGPIL